MWSQDSSDKQKTTLESNPSVDSGFLSNPSENLSMRGCSNNTLSETFVRDLSLKYSTINNLETNRTQQLNNMHKKIESFVTPVKDLKFMDLEKTNLLEQPYEFFYTQDCRGNNQLHIAIVMERVECALWLINKAPHPCLFDIVDDDSHGALHLAVMAHQPEVVRRLVLAGANTKLRTDNGYTALHFACASNDLACAKALTEPLSNFERNWVASNNRQPPLLPQNLEEKNYIGQTCLHLAVSKGHIEMVDLLVRCGADVEAQEGLAGNRALHIAVQNKHRDIVHYLVQVKRSCLEGTNYAGDTAYQIALEYDREIAEDLLKYGASPIINHRYDSDSDSSCSTSEDEMSG